MGEICLDCAVEVKLLEQAAATQQTDGRRGERVEADGMTTVVRESGFWRPGPMRIVKVLDISSGGISFEYSRSMPTGQKVELSIDTPARDGIKAVGRVRYCIRWASSFRIGVEFVEISAADQRALTKEHFGPSR
ncbi:MAG TPA: PilZ domain-containing protein [Planctomycetota bacterium]|nr:PilZ domain-containing protein [Planctomycetota bacterium]